MNECWYIGPNLQPLLYDILLRMRINPIWLTGDVKQAFLQVSVSTQDRDALRFLYVLPEAKQELHLRFTHLPFGGGPSPFGMIAVFRKLWGENENEFPQTVRKLKQDTYVDDVNQGDHDVTNLQNFRDEAMEIFKRGKFELRKWQSNESSLNDPDLPNETKLLGLNWNKRKDTLTFSFNKETRPVTKRDVLHTVNSIYDPLGLIEPLRIFGKHLYREACDLERCWDKILPPEFQKQWKKWMGRLDNICIPRSITTVLEPIQWIDLHMFGDSSEMASATSGIAVIKHPSQITSGILSSRARVANRGVTMPRLELVANHMNVNMGCNIYKALRDVVEIHQVYVCTDFQVALRWITNPQLSWKQFVSNRVQKINEKGEEMNVKWLYCPTEENPVDIATRGCKSSDLDDKWWV